MKKNYDVITFQNIFILRRQRVANFAEISNFHTKEKVKYYQANIHRTKQKKSW